MTKEQIQDLRDRITSLRRHLWHRQEDWWPEPNTGNNYKAWFLG